MKYCIFLFLLFISIDIAHTQENIISIHPKIGDTISLSEKKDFNLFPQIRNTKYSYAIIRQVKDSYYLNFFYSDNTFSAKEIDTADLSSYFRYIENQIMNSSSKEINSNDLEMRPLDSGNEKSKGDLLITPDMRKEINYKKRK